MSSSDSDDALNYNIELILAVRKKGKKELEKIEILLHNGADANFRDGNFNHNTALHFAVSRKDVEVVKLLLASGANANIQNDEHKTPLDIAKRNNDEEIVHILEEHWCRNGILESSQVTNSQKDVIPAKSSDDFLNRTALTYASSGLKNTLPGTMYQVKLHLLFLSRATAKHYNFLLATDMLDAEKFDDLVVKCKLNDQTVFTFMQLKHRQEESKLIMSRELLDANGQFSLTMYFKAYRNINRKSIFMSEENSKKEFIIFTNTNFDVEELESKDIKLRNVQIENELFLTDDRGECFNLVINKEDILWQSLKETSNVHSLAKILATCVTKNENLTSKDHLIQTYNAALNREVFTVKQREKKHVAIFRENFLRGDCNISQGAKVLREAFHEECLKIHKEQEITNFWENLSDKAVMVSKSFKGSHKVPEDPQINDINTFTKEFALKIEENFSSKFIELKNPKDDTSVIGRHIDKLAGHVLVYEKSDLKPFEKRVEFSQAFLTNTNLAGNLNSFRQLLESELKDKNIPFSSLSKIVFKIEEYKTWEENQVYLPNDEVTETDIDDFFNDLIFAVQQPNERELENIIKQEIRERFAVNDNNSDFVLECAQRQIVEWCKEKGKESRYLTYVDGTIIFDKAMEKLRWSVLSEISLEFRNEIKRFDLEFKTGCTQNLHMNKFLSSEDEKVFIIETQQTILSALKVIQALQHVPEFKADDNYLIMRLGTVQHMKEYVHQVFKSDYCNLQVIECDSDETDAHKVVHDLFEIVKAEKKYLILLTKSHKQLSNLIEKSNLKYKKHFDEDFFKGLTTTSKYKVLGRKVSFQGVDLPLKELLKYTTHKIDVALKIVDDGCLFRLLKNDKVKVGHKIESMDDFKDYYVQRELSCNKEIEVDVFYEISTTDTFAVSGTTEEDFRQLTGCNDVVVTFDSLNFSRGEHSRIYILDSEENEERYFQKLCENMKERNIHWLKCQDSKFVWIQTHGNISNLRQFINKEMSTKVELQQVFDILERFVLVSAEPGMGKSTLLTYLAHQTKQQNPSAWIVKVNLNDQTHYLSEMRDKDWDFTTIIEFLSHVLHLESSSEKVLFEDMFSNSGDVIVLFDGFDEISPYYKQNIIKLLQMLKMTNVRSVWVTTRQHLECDLENEIGLFSYKLVPFSENMQEEFIRKFWTSKDTKMSEANVARIIQRLQKITFEHAQYEQTKFTGLPLHLRMIVDTLKGKSSLPDKIRVAWFYEEFVRIKYHNIYRQIKKKEDTTNVYSNEADQKHYRKFLRSHELSALKVLFNDNDLKILLSKNDGKNLNKYLEDVKSGADGVGIITEVVSNKPRFIHRTFAEYFASLWFADCVQLHKNLENIRPVLIETYFGPIHHFLDHSLAQKSKIHVALLNNDINTFESLIDNKNNVDKGGRTPLHICSTNEHKEIMEILMRSDVDVNVKDTLFEWTPLEYSLKNEDYEMMDLLLEKGANGSGIFLKPHLKFDMNAVFKAAVKNGYTYLTSFLLNEGVKVVCRDFCPLENLSKWSDKLEAAKFLFFRQGIRETHDTECVQKSLHRAVCCNTYELVKYLIQEVGPEYIKAKVKILELGIRKGSMDIVKLLVDEMTFDSVECTNPHLIGAICFNVNVFNYVKSKGISLKLDSGSEKRLFTKIVRLGKIEVVKNFLDNYETEIEILDDKGESALFHAVRAGNLDVVEYLINENGAKHDVTNKDQQTLLHVSASQGKLKTVKYLIGTLGANTQALDSRGATPLFSAAAGGSVEVFKYLVKDEGVDLKITNTNGSTLLHESAFKGNLEMVKYLVDTLGADIYATNKSGATPIFSAAVGGSVEVLKYFINDKGVDSNITNANGSTLLHEAAFKGKLEVVKYLLNTVKVCVEVCDSRGATPLFSAATGGSLEVLKYLIITKKANSQITNKYGTTLLHTSAFSGQLNIVKYLIDFVGCNVDVCDNNGAPPLFSAAAGGNVEVLKYLILRKKTDHNITNKHGTTLLHISAFNGKLEMVKYLIDNLGANIEACDYNGATPVFSAAAGGRVEVLMYLIKEKGAEFKGTNKNGMTPLKVATLKNKSKVVSYLTNISASDV